MRLYRYLLLGFFIIVSLSYVSQQAVEAQKSETKKSSDDPMSSGTFAGLTLRSIGPALTSGRISDFAVNPKDRSHYYVSAASGGVWKTTNAGTTWTPIFDDQGSYSIGCLAIDPNNPAVLWVGTGENNSQRSVSYGDGIYRTEDGGKSWKNLGLKSSEHIGKILIDPRNSNTVFVAAQGPLWGPGGDRGLYKTTDAGKNWKPVLSISENTGVTDVVMDPENPDLLYAAAYQRRRHVYTLINGGPEGALYRSTDGGETWDKIKAGLPGEDIGRIGLAIAPSESNVVYAQIEAANNKGGIFRSTDHGISWEKRNDYTSQPMMYYGPINVDPKNSDRIYLMGTYIMTSDDGGKTVRRLPEKGKHVDSHIMWIDPDNPNYLLVGCDGGIYETYDRAANWAYKSNLPITQFYDITVDNAAPFYNVYGGTQDNFTLGGPTRTRNVNGVANSDWFVVNGGDGFRVQVDPEDPNTVYAESQYGGLVRFDRRTGEIAGIKPQPTRDEEQFRWNWDSPMIISPHSRTRLYFASNKLFRSDDRGNSWKVINEEVSRKIDRNKLPVMGRVWGVDAVSKHGSTSLYGNATALSESPKKEGLIYIGSDDGLVQISDNGGANWRKLEKFPGVPEMTYVSRLLASQHDANTVYAAFENHKNSDFAPYLLKSVDAGKTWTSIKGNLPDNGPVLAIAEDHVNPNLLFVGTEFGLFFSINGGQKWIQLKGGLPTIAVRDLVIQKRENDLVVGTFGRGIYVLDNYAPLRMIKPEMFSQENVIFPVKDAMLYIQSLPIGGKGKGFLGETHYLGDNPAYGATITYYLKDSLKTKKKLRQESEKEADKNKQPARYPSFDELRAESEEPEPEIILTIKDSAGNVVRKLRGGAAAGVQRVTWNLRFPETSLSQGNPDEEEPSAPLVLPGTYKVTMAKRVGGVLSPLAGEQTINVVVDGIAQLSPADRAALSEFQQKVAKLQRSVLGALEMANSLRGRVTAIKRALQETPAADDKLFDNTLVLEKQTNELLRALRGDNVLRARNENSPLSIVERVNGIVEDQVYSLSRPTQTHQDAYAVASQLFSVELNKLRKLVDVDLKNLEKALDSAGAPWTPGRIPEWNDK